MKLANEEKMMHDFNARARTWDEDPARRERARQVAEKIAGQVPLHGRMQALEYGAGTGLLAFALEPHLGKVVLTDSSSGMLEVAADKIAAAGLTEKLQTLLLDLLQDPLPGERFDLVVTLLTLHHIPDIAGILEKFYQLLKNPGWMCIADLDKEDGSFHGPGFTGHNGFEREELVRLVTAAGFRQVRIETALTLQKRIEGVERGFPLFLLIAEK